MFPNDAQAGRAVVDGTKGSMALDELAQVNHVVFGCVRCISKTWSSILFYWRQLGRSKKPV